MKSRSLPLTVILFNNAAVAAGISGIEYTLDAGDDIQCQRAEVTLVTSGKLELLVNKVWC